MADWDKTGKRDETQPPWASGWTADDAPPAASADDDTPPAAPLRGADDVTPPPPSRDDGEACWAPPAGSARGWLATRGRHLTLAVTFLTAARLPDPGAEVAPAELWASMGLYPLVGLVLGLVGWGAYA